MGKQENVNEPVGRHLGRGKGEPGQISFKYFSYLIYLLTLLCERNRLDIITSDS